MAGRLNARAFVLAFVVLGLFAASADAKTKVIESKIVITSVNDDFSFNAVVKSTKGRCLPNRAIGYEVPGVSDSGTTNQDGTFVFSGDWHDFSDATSVPVKLKPGEKFGKPSKRKRCGGDTATLDVARGDDEIVNFAFDDGTDLFSGGISTSVDARCANGRAVQITHSGGTPQYEATADNLGDFSFSAGPTRPSGNYTAFIPSRAIFESTGQGNMFVSACRSDFSPAIAVP
jgi:hypothetical protein